MTDAAWSWLGEGGGDAAAVMREVDWAATAVGPVQSWPPELKSIVSMMLYARHPMFLWWGPDLVQFYNDGYTPSFGVGRHPAAMGQRGTRKRPIKFFYATQTGVRPPTFTLFCTEPESVQPAYRRFLENRLRERYGLEGVPVRLRLRARARKAGGKGAPR